jgi:response regulator RpfG family c-di-GMP phosphodiesterase
MHTPALPAGDAEAALDRAIDAGRKAGGNASRVLLLVDDEANILAAIRRLLRPEGYRVITAASAAEGLEALAANHVDIVISDQRMPGMTGVEFLRRVKDLRPEVLRLVLSGYTDRQSITHAIEEGAIYKFLTKPWDDGELRSHIAEALCHKKIMDDNRRLATVADEPRAAVEDAAGQLRALVAENARQFARERAIGATP